MVASRCSEMKAPCGKDCSSCELFDLCGGCRRPCLAYECYKRGYVIPNVTGDCGLCPLHGCPKKRIAFDAERSLRAVKRPPRVGARVRMGRLPSFVPLIDVRGPDSWRSKDVRAIMVKFRDLVERYGILEEDIHEVLGFEGKVLLSSIAQDKFLTSEHFGAYKEAVATMKPDAILTWDLPVYVDDPLFRNWMNVLKSIEAAAELSKLGVPLIGLVKGSTEKQIAFSAAKFSRMGIKDMALHCTEYLQLKAIRVMKEFLAVVSDYANRVIAMGVSSPEALETLKDEMGRGEVIPCGLSWHISAQYYQLFSRYKKVDLKRMMVTCNCGVCRGRKPDEIGRSRELIASHNLSLVFGKLKGRPPSVDVWDLVIDGRKAVFVSDLHIGTIQSLWTDAVEFLRGERADYVVFLGDTFDFKYGSPSLRHFRGFFGALEKLNATVVPAFGETDRNLEYVMGRARRLAFKAGENPLYSTLEPTDRRASEAFLQLYRFYSNAKDRLRIKAGGETISARHCKFLEEPFLKGEVSDPSSAISSMRAEGRLARYPTWVICAHLHMAGLDRRKHAVSLGCWQHATPWYKSRFGSEHFGVRTALVVERDGTIGAKSLSPAGRSSEELSL